MQDVIYELNKALKDPFVVSDTELQMAIINVINGLNQIIILRRRLDEKSKRASSPCPCGTCPIED